MGPFGNPFEELASMDAKKYLEMVSPLNSSYLPNLNRSVAPISQQDEADAASQLRMHGSVAGDTGPSKAPFKNILNPGGFGPEPGISSLGELKRRDEPRTKDIISMLESSGSLPKSPAPGASGTLRAPLALQSQMLQGAAPSKKPLPGKGPVIEGESSVIAPKPMDIPAVKKGLYGAGLEDEDLAEARQIARDRALNANLGSIFADAISTITNTENDSGLYNRLAQQSDEGVREIKEGRQSFLEKRALEKDISLDDPANPRAKQLAAALKRDFGIDVGDGFTLRDWNESGGDVVKLSIASREKAKDRANELAKTEAANRAKVSDEKAKSEKERQERSIPGLGTFQTKALKEEFLKSSPEAQGTLEALDELINYAKNRSVVETDPASRARIAQLAKRAQIGAFKELIGKEPSERSMRIAEDLVQDPSTILDFTDKDLASLVQSRDAIRQSLQNKVGAWLEPSEDDGLAAKRKRLQELKSKAGQ